MERIKAEIEELQERLRRAESTIHVEGIRWPMTTVYHTALHHYADASDKVENATGKTEPKEAEEALGQAKEHMLKLEQYINNPPRLEPPEATNLKNLTEHIKWLAHGAGGRVKTNLSPKLEGVTAEVYTSGIEETIKILYLFSYDVSNRKA